MEILTNWTWIHTFVYVTGFVLVYGGARLLYHFSRRKWTVEIRLKVLAIALFSWLTIIVMGVATLIEWFIRMTNFKIDWNKEVKI